jgi:arginase family enzyme
MTPAEVFRGLPRSIPWYLSFDVDCLDPSFASATATRVVGGLSYYQALELIAYAARRFEIVGADFVETCASLGPFNATAAAAARYLAQLFLSRCPSRPLATYRYTFPARPVRPGARRRGATVTD